MPRIRKKTSRRGTTHQREKVKHKVAETRKKRKKEAKKNPQWKSKHKKDPGIPNNFPYKDQILAEVAEERRRAAQEKERRKEEKKVAKAQIIEGEVTRLGAGIPEDDAGGASTATLHAEDVVNDIPVLVNRDLPNLRSVIDAVDVVVQVLDARDPLRCRSYSLEEAAKEKKTIYILNKVATCPREAVQEWAASLRSQHPAVLFRSASAFLPDAPELAGKGKTKERADDAWGVDSVMELLKKWRQDKEGAAPLAVAVVGVTNAGKSSFINSLLRKPTLPIYKLSSAPLDGPTTTAYPQEASLEIDGERVRIIDTPGLAWHSPDGLSAEDSERIRAHDILHRNRGRIERLKDPTPVVAELVSRADKEDLMLFYNLPAFAAGDASAFLAGVARSHGLIKKGGVPDLAGASRIVLRDWSTGKLPRYTRPLAPAPVPASLDPAFADAYAKDEDVLSRLQTRKEMRKTRGVVKLAAGEVDRREVMLDASWFVVDEDEDEDEDDDEEEVDELDESDDVAQEDVDDDDDEEDEKEDDEDEGEPVLAAGKRKRSAQRPPPRQIKKVAFAAEPKGTKQARSAAGSKGSQSPAFKMKGDAAPAQAKGNAAPPAKPAKAQKKTQSVTSAMKKIANSSSKKAKVAVPALQDGEETYDFTKFF